MTRNFRCVFEPGMIVHLSGTLAAQMMVDFGQACSYAARRSRFPIHQTGSVPFSRLYIWAANLLETAGSASPELLIKKGKITVSQCLVGRTWASVLILAAAFVAVPHGFAQPGGPQPPKHYPWSDATLSPDARADMVIKELTLEEKISLLHGQGFSFNSTGPTESNGGAGYSVAIPRVGIPAIQMADSAYGVTRGAASGRYSTALPNNLAAASSWDPQVGL